MPHEIRSPQQQDTTLYHTMPVFSATAPVVDEAQEALERQSLDEEERASIQEDLYGHQNYASGASSASPPSTLPVAALELLQEALEALSEEERASYDQACRQVPDLVERESPALAFFTAAGGDAWKAAAMMAGYWRQRRLLFGARAYSAMTLDGAMAEHVPVLERGLFRPCGMDQHGRTVVFYDRNRAVEQATREEVLRMAFYVWQTILMSDEWYKGAVFVINVRNFDLCRHVDRVLAKKLFRLGESFPISTRALHACIGSEKSILNMLLPEHKVIMGRRIRLRFCVHTGVDLASSFVQYGLGAEPLQAVLDRSYNQAATHAWLQAQRQVEGRRAVAATGAAEA